MSHSTNFPMCLVVLFYSHVVSSKNYSATFLIKVITKLGSFGNLIMIPSNYNASLFVNVKKF